VSGVESRQYVICSALCVLHWLPTAYGCCECVYWRLLNPYRFKDEACLFYIRTHCVPRCKHSPLRL
jgi:hypothetical protein